MRACIVTYGFEARTLMVAHRKSRGAFRSATSRMGQRGSRANSRQSSGSVSQSERTFRFANVYATAIGSVSGRARQSGFTEDRFASTEAQ
jgi:hypothetical protein